MPALRTQIDTSLPAEKAEPRHNLLSDYIELFKLRVTTMIVITGGAGFYLASLKSGISAFNSGLLHALSGIAIVSCGASALNQVMERRTDALMVRTQNRPLAAGRMGFAHGLLLGFAAIVLGSLWLAQLNFLTGLLTLLTAIGYVAIYTPLKRITTLATFLGAFPGAMPPLLGWTAVRGEIEWPAVALFSILFVWQFPHFMAIGWLYREQYGRAGIKVLPVTEPGGLSTVVEALAYAVLMVPVSLAPVWLHMDGKLYGVAALLLGAGYLFYTIRFARITKTSPEESRVLARNLLKASVVYLPLLLVAMMADATGHLIF
ncbi:MAG TPA: heme o synthase [Acidobacteriaceae bacterium]|nr:heme o synthase [Acidobacteriaceae bacterium]